MSEVLVDSHGTNTGTNQNTSITTGRIGSGFAYNGTSSLSLILHNATLNIANNFTLMADIYPTAVGQIDTSIIVGKMGAVTEQEWSIGFNANRNIRFRVGGSFDYVSTGQCPLNQWSRIVCRYKQNEIWEITINGISENNTPRTALNTLLGMDVGIGSQPTTNGGVATNTRFTGRLDNVYIWNRSITNDELGYLTSSPVSYNDFATYSDPTDSISAIRNNNQFLLGSPTVRVNGLFQTYSTKIKKSGGFN